MKIYQTIIAVILSVILIMYVIPKLVDLLGESYYKVWYEKAVIVTIKDNIIEECVIK